MNFNIKLYKAKGKRAALAFVCMLLVCSLTACTANVEKRYQTYIKSLISINYLGATKEYIEASGANQADADALYQANIDLLTDNILTYYSVNIDDAPEMRAQFEELAKTIYSKVNFSVGKARKDGSVYVVDVTIYPINLFAQTSADVTNLVNTFNDGVKAGLYNDYTLTEYETEFAQQLLSILNTGCENMSYADPQVVTVEIIEDGNKYYISDRDFRNIDAAMINSSVVTETGTATDAQ